MFNYMVLFRLKNFSIDIKNEDSIIYLTSRIWVYTCTEIYTSKEVQEGMTGIVTHVIGIEVVTIIEEQKSPFLVLSEIKTQWKSCWTHIPS